MKYPGTGITDNCEPPCDLSTRDVWPWFWELNVGDDAMGRAGSFQVCEGKPVLDLSPCLLWVYQQCEHFWTSTVPPSSLISSSPHAPGWLAASISPSQKDPKSFE